MGIIMWFLNLGWKILGIIAGFMLLSYILGQGVDGIRDVLSTIGLAVRAMGHAIRKKLIHYLRKESGAEPEGEPEKPEEQSEEPEEDEKETKDDGPVFVYMSYEDLQKVIKGESNTP